MDTSSLGDRMKEYERCYDQRIIGRVPVIVRCDGKKFSKFTKKISAQKPFDEIFSSTMAEAAKHAASEIDGCLFGYTQSDEITFVIRNDQSLDTTPWFGNRVQKICSVVSSMVTAAFNTELMLILNADPKTHPIAHFDTRVFAVPNIMEAQNLLRWRQNDAVKNSISSACYYEVAKKVGKKTARKMMYKLNQNQQQELLFQETGINWNNYPVRFKRGIGVRKVVREFTTDAGEKFMRSKWETDIDIPSFTKDQQYLVNVLCAKEEKD